MADFKISVIINQTLDIVWKAFIDPENMLHYTKYLEKVETIQGKFGEIGAIAHLHYLEKGRTYILEDKLVDYEEGKKIGSRVSGQGMIIDVENHFESLPDGTKMTMGWSGTSKSFLTRIILKLMQKKIAKHAREELLTFKKLTEEYGSKFLVKND
jgi:uncharacterized membrane protein